MKKEFGYVQDREGNAVAGAEVYIRIQSNNNLATLYSDDGSTTTANPLTTDNDGEWSAYWADGVYKIQVYVEGVQQQEVNNFQHFDIDGFTAYGISLASAANAAAAKALLDLEPGVDVQAYDAELAAIAGLTSAADKGIQFTGSGTAATYDLTAAGKALLDDANATAQRATLGLVLSTAAEYRNDTADRVLTGAIVWDAAEPVALAESGGNVAVDMNSGINFTLAMTGNWALSNPTNEKPGQNGFIQITQDATGSRTLSYGSEWKFPSGSDPVLSTTANAVDVLFYQVLSSGVIFGNLVKDIA